MMLGVMMLGGNVGDDVRDDMHMILNGFM